MFYFIRFQDGSGACAVCDRSVVENVVITTQRIHLSLAWQVSIAVLLTAIIVTMPDPAFAQSADSPVGNVLCTVAGWFTGNTGKGLATISVIIMGIGSLLGKVSSGMAILAGTGVSIVFGAGSIVSTMGGGVGAC